MKKNLKKLANLVNEGTFAPLTTQAIKGLVGGIEGDNDNAGFETMGSTSPYHSGIYSGTGTTRVCLKSCAKV
jgi:hypothetical protein